MRGVWWVLAVAGAGCAPADVDLFLALPPAPDASRFVFDVPGADPVVLDPASPGDFALRLDVSEGAPAVEVLAYDDDALPVGPLVAAPAGEIGLSLPNPDDVFTLAVDGELASWEPAASSALSSSFLRRLCAPITAVTESWDVPGFPQWAEPIGEEVVFAMETAGEITMYRTDGGAPVMLANPFERRAAPFSVWRAANDSVWYGATNGRVYRGRLTRDGIVDITEQYAFPSSFTDVRIDGHLDASRNIELFAVTDYGNVAHFDGNGFVAVEGSVDFGEQHVVWHAPGEALIVENETTNVAVVRGGRIRRIAGPEEVVHSLAQTALGTMVGLGNGTITRFEADEWSTVGRQPSAFVLDIIDADGGLFFLLASGRVGRFHDPQGLCEAQGVLPVLGFRGLLSRLGDGLFVIGELNSSAAVTQGARLAIGGP
ncbi:MAG: hypothetical protein RIT81_35465 [Deltaproteobacteria bacterium]